jgi:Ion channel
MRLALLAPTLERAAVYFSTTTCTAVGFGDVVPGPGWRDRGTAGLIPVGWSTAFVLAVMNRSYAHWRQVHDAS